MIMKKRLHILLAGLLALAPSCDKNSVDPGGDELYDLSEVSVVEEGSIPLEDFYQKLLQDASAANDGFDQNLYDHYKNLLEQARAQGGGTKGDSGSSISMAYAWTTLRYTTLSVTGEQIKCSELLVWPYVPFTKQTPKNVIVGCHLTITSDDERPSNFSNLGFSNDVNMLALFANPLSQSALVIIPDYEGYGSTRDRNHPYCDREATVRQVMDGARAGIAWFQNEKKELAGGWKSVAVGYSQGGAVAGSVYRFCQEHNVSGLRLAGAVCGDGPYDPMATFSMYSTDGRLFMPVAVALLLKGAVDTDPCLRELGCKYEDLCTPEFMDTGIFGFLQGKDLSTADIHKQLLKASKKSDDGFKLFCWSESRKEFLPYNPANAADPHLQLDLSNGNGKNYAPIEMCVKPSLVEYLRSGKLPGDIPEGIAQAVRDCLERNSLAADGWVPAQAGGLTFFHSATDEVVPCSNLEAMEKSWSAVLQNFSSYRYTSGGTSYHKSAGTLFYISYSGTYTEEILSGKWTAVHKEI